MKKPVIFYGIMRSVKDKIDKYIEIAGEPVVFSSKDEDIDIFKGKITLINTKFFLWMMPLNSIRTLIFGLHTANRQLLSEDY